MRTSPYLRVVLFFVLAAAAFQSVACARTPATLQSFTPPAAPAVAFPQALPGDKTAACDRVLAVLRDLQGYANGRRARGVAFQFTEAEIDEYLAYSLALKPRQGVSRLAVRFFPNDEVSVLAAIDFAAVRKWNEWLIPESLRPALAGPRPVRLDIKFQAAGGLGSFKLKSVSGPGDSVISRVAMEWIVQAIAVHQPEWYDTTRDIPLPFSLRRIWTDRQFVSGDMAPPPLPRTDSGVGV